uniref:hypothetical protein n=1 Tax=Parerythrobacter lutipelagi TaxID=1964208 RepID=UPI001F02B90C|nr:hypothetical protein [Parerythrobacter lutipelagi]
MTIHGKLALFPLLLAICIPSAPLAASNASAQGGLQLSLEQQTALRCSAAFAIVADGQTRGNAKAARFPPLGQRGREFFVRASARLMDETGMDREAVAALLSMEARKLREDDTLEDAMPACLLLLDASGL